MRVRGRGSRIGRAGTIAIAIAVAVVMGLVPAAGAAERRSMVSVGAASSAVGAATTVPMYRFRNMVTGAYCYSADLGMVSWYLADAFTYEYQGVAFWLPNQASATIPVYWFYNTYTDGDFFTPSAAEVDDVSTRLPQFDYLGVGFYALPQSPALVKVSRLYELNSESHLYSARPEEIAAALACSSSRYVLDGTSSDFWVSAVGDAWEPEFGDAPGGPPAPPPDLGDPGSPPEPTPMPVYRFYNFRKGVHFYTASETEKSNTIATLSGTFNYEGQAYTINTSSPDNNLPLYRFYNMKTGVHFYTASAAEKDLVATRYASTYRLEGEAYKVCATPVAGAFPVYRFYNLKKGVHFYTASEAEKTNVILKLSSTYRFEGPAFYVAP